MKIISTISDFILSVVLFLGMLVGFVLGAIIARLHRLIQGRPATQGMLTLLSGSLRQAAKRNINCVYDASTLHGYFTHCIFLHYLADAPLKEDYNAQIQLIDFRAAWGDWLKKNRLHIAANLYQELAFLFYTYQLILKKHLTLIQANDPYIQGAHAYLLSKMTGIPYVLRVVCDYDHYYECFKRLAFPILRFRWIEKKLERAIFRRADGVIPWTENYARYALKNGAIAEHTAILPAFTDPRYFSAYERRKDISPPSSLDCQKNQLLLYLGRLSWDKYCLDLIDCLAEVTKSHPRVKLVILGDGELRGEFEAKAREKNVYSHLHLPGMQTVDEIISWALNAKVMLVTHGGFSLVELGAVGLPIVAYDYEWHPELIKNGETGFLVPFHDTQSMANAAIKILDDATLATDMAAKIRKATREKHHPDVVQERMAEFFRILERS